MSSSSDFESETPKVQQAKGKGKQRSFVGEKSSKRTIPGLGEPGCIKKKDFALVHWIVREKFVPFLVQRARNQSNHSKMSKVQI